VLLPTSFRSTALAALAIRLVGAAGQRDRYLAELGAGKLAAVPPELPRGRFSLELAGGRLRASGRQPLVSHAGSADLLLVFAASGEGLLGLLVPRGAAGVGLSRLPALGGQPVFAVTLDGVELEREAVLGLDSDQAERTEAWERWLDHALSLLCMEMAGGAGRVVEITAEYVKQRYQFGRPLGSFQAVQHHLANMLIESDGAHAAALQALWTAAYKPRAARETSTAKLWAARAYRSNTVLAHQLHGGAGYVREAGLHLYSERAAADSVSLGTREDHLRRLWAAGRD
jgi:alkylation response protein AidB-like acyl-CoA dehydrogenase